MTKPLKPRNRAAQAAEPPLPGTPEALALGCRCPMADDPEQRKTGLVIYVGHCPVHRELVAGLQRKRCPAKAS